MPHPNPPTETTPSAPPDTCPDCGHPLSDHGDADCGECRSCWADRADADYDAMRDAPSPREELGRTDARMSVYH